MALQLCKYCSLASVCAKCSPAQEELGSCLNQWEKTNVKANTEIPNRSSGQTARGNDQTHEHRNTRTIKYCWSTDEMLDSPESVFFVMPSANPYQATCARRSMNGDEARIGAGGSDDGPCLWGIQRLEAMEVLLHAPLKSSTVCWEPCLVGHGLGDVHIFDSQNVQFSLTQHCKHFKSSSARFKVQLLRSKTLIYPILSHSKYPKTLFKSSFASPWRWQAPQKLIHQQGRDVTDLPGRSFLCCTEELDFVHFHRIWGFGEARVFWSKNVDPIQYQKW